MNKVVISKNNIFYDTYLPFSGEVIEDVPSIESIFLKDPNANQQKTVLHTCA
jgi:hypothetical protein